MIRKSFTELDSDERSTLADAFNTLWDDGTIEANADLHDVNFLKGIHWGPAFLPWHRDFLRKLELALQRFDAGIVLPYWDWSKSDSRDIDVAPWKEIFGGRPNSGGKFDNWTYTRNGDPGQWKLPTPADVVSELEADSYLSFRALETGSHVPGHTWTGGTMATGRSPLDPLFYLHHCNLDRLWAIWQLNNPALVQYEHTGVLSSDRVPEARVPLDSAMIGGATPASMLDHVALGYTYDRDEELEEFWYDKNGTDLITHSEPAIV
jgi:Common central domain of tyrosinase